MEQKTLAIIVPNWNGWKDTVECLESLFNNTWQDFSVIIVDNGSQDNSVQHITSWAEDRVGLRSYPLTELEAGGDINQDIESRITLVRSEENHGFAGGCNIGIRHAIRVGFDRVFLLNNDTVVQRDCLEVLANFYGDNRHYQVITPLINYYARPEIVWCFGGKLTFTGRRHLNYTDKPEVKISKKIKRVSFVSGCALYAGIELFKRYGMLTERFFFGEEDYHFSVVMKKNGIQIAAVAQAKILHKVCRSNEKIFNTNERLPYMFIGYLNRFINKKIFCSSILYWKFWRFLNFLYIIPKLILSRKYDIRQILHLYHLLRHYSNERDEVSKALFFEAKNLFKVN